MISPRYYLHILFYKISPRKRLIEEDILHYQEVTRIEGGYIKAMCKIFNDRPEFRNLFYYRLGKMRGMVSILKWIARPIETLYIYTSEIGGGLFIQHGFATIICAKSIGRHCSINQQVTIGYKGNFCPIIGDNVSITCGAKVLGNVVVGDNVIIGANAVVVKDVPSDTIVGGVPARIIKKNSKV